MPSFLLSSLIAKSTVLTPEKKQAYAQMLSYLSPEASSQLEALLLEAENKAQQMKEQEEITLSHINNESSRQMNELVKTELGSVQAQMETDESAKADDMLTTLNAL